jgi:hypothetical protein
MKNNWNPLTTLMRTMLFIVAISALFSPASVFAIDRYIVGDTLYVWAISGLTLRSAPNAKAERVTVVPYGATLVSLEEKLNIYSNNVDIKTVPAYVNGGMKHEALFLHGRFIQVKYGEQIGYVFDGYLSVLPTMNITSSVIDKKVYQSAEEADKWLSRTIGLLESRSIRVSQMDDYAESTFFYKKGIICKHITSKSGESYYVFPDISLQVGYLIFNCMTDYENQIKNSINETGWMHGEESENNMGFSSGMCSYNIKLIPGFNLLIISVKCSC